MSYSGSQRRKHLLLDNEKILLKSEVLGNLRKNQCYRVLKIQGIDRTVPESSNYDT